MLINDHWSSQKSKYQEQRSSGGRAGKGGASRFLCYVFCICLLTNKYQKYKTVVEGEQAQLLLKGIVNAERIFLSQIRIDRRLSMTIKCLALGTGSLDRTKRDNLHCLDNQQSQKRQDNLSFLGPGEGMLIRALPSEGISPLSPPYG